MRSFQHPRRRLYGRQVPGSRRPVPAEEAHHGVLQCARVNRVAVLFLDRIESLRRGGGGGMVAIIAAML